MMNYENFFDGFDDLIEFPSDNECSDGNLVSSNFPTWDEALQFYDPLFSGGSVPYEDVMPLDKDNTDTLQNQIRTSSPISLERNSSSTSKAVPRVPQRARSKRPEPASTESSPMKKSDKKIKIANEDACPALVRKCSHCGITKTPQWRAGPTGPKTLCNACGVRFKSGRLFPEYRPAASPTFVPALHSNSHKKVIEMRGRACS